VNDFGTRPEVTPQPDVAFSASVQYERGAFPLPALQPQSNATSSFQLTFTPHRSAR
jgi:hypothetical protein